MMRGMLAALCCGCVVAGCHATRWRWDSHWYPSPRAAVWSPPLNCDARDSDPFDSTAPVTLATESARDILRHLQERCGEEFSPQYAQGFERGYVEAQFTDGSSAEQTPAAFTQASDWTDGYRDGMEIARHSLTPASKASEAVLQVTHHDQATAPIVASENPLPPTENADPLPQLPELTPSDTTTTVGFSLPEPTTPPAVAPALLAQPPQPIPPAASSVAPMPAPAPQPVHASPYRSYR